MNTITKIFRPFTEVETIELFFKSPWNPVVPPRDSVYLEIT